MFYTPISDIACMERTKSDEPQFLHVINPFTSDKGTEHDVAQSTTFSCISNAKKVAKNVDVEVICAVYPEDAGIVPDEFRCLPLLSRSVSDIHTFSSQKKLPLLFDILDVVKTNYNATDNQYIIYSNIDIAPMPLFYDLLRDITMRDIDAIVINRRTVSEKWGKGNNETLMYSDVGKVHPGTDCFIFKRKIFDEFIKSETCIGALCVMKSLLYNLAALSERMVIIPDAHATLHIGDDRVWMAPEFKEFALHNQREGLSVAEKLIEKSPACRERLKKFTIERNEELLFSLLEITPPLKIIMRAKEMTYQTIKYVVKKYKTISTLFNEK